MKIKKHANFEMLKIYSESIQSKCRLAQLFLDTLAVILRRKSEIVGEFVSPTLEMQFGRFY